MLVAPTPAPVANAAQGALNTRIAVAATSSRRIDVNISVLLVD
jgi:hypothetical protein